MKFFLQWIIVFGFLAVLISIPLDKKEYIFSEIKSVKIAGVVLKTELALTTEEKKIGLSGRSSLKDDESMLFVFDSSDHYSFWMKDMNFPIDIIWIGEDLLIVDIKKNAEPQLSELLQILPPEIFTPEKDAKYILEVNAGFSEKHNLKVGDRVEFNL